MTLVSFEGVGRLQGSVEPLPDWLDARLAESLDEA